MAAQLKIRIKEFLLLSLTPPLTKLDRVVYGLRERRHGQASRGGGAGVARRWRGVRAGAPIVRRELGEKLGQALRMDKATA